MIYLKFIILCIKELFFKSEFDKFYSKIAKKYGLRYERFGEKSFHMGPKNGHEITVSVGADNCLVRCSYYGTFYGESELVKDLEEFLKSYDFKFVPKVMHKFNYLSSK